MKTILVPTDFSDGAYKALEYAAQLARKFDASIIVVHAFDLPAQGINVMIDISSELQKNAQQDLKKLEKKATKDQLTTGIKIEYLALLGELNEVIQTVTEERPVELVVMGTKGESDLSSKLFGTNTVSAIKHIHVPLLVIPSEAFYKPIKHIAFAVDYLKPKGENTLDILRDLAKAFGAKIQMVNVHTDGDIGEFMATIKDLQGWYLEKLDGVEVDFVFVSNYIIEDGVFEHMRENHTDLLVMVTRQHSFFDRIFRKSISEELALHSDVPLLTLHE
jgi:nucleotide-binding universal stress UspA family protein